MNEWTWKCNIFLKPLGDHTKTSFLSYTGQRTKVVFLKDRLSFPSCYRLQSRIADKLLSALQVAIFDSTIKGIFIIVDREFLQYTIFQ